jgi:hypothetical protein
VAATSSSTPSPTATAAGLAACSAHPEFVDPASCAANSSKGLAGNRNSFPSVPPPGTKAPTQSSVEAIARQFARVPPDAAAPSERTTYGLAVTRMSGSPSPALDPGLPVWLVTVDALMDVSRAPDDTRPVRSVYTVISDAANGAVIDSCAGCDAVAN